MSAKSKKRITWMGIIGCSLGLALAALYLVHLPRVGNAPQFPEGSVSELKDYHLSVSKLLLEVNKRRADAGVAALAGSTELDASAQQKCDDMYVNKYYGHVSPKSGKQGYEYAISALGNVTGHYSENLTGALKTDTESDVFDFWFKSQVHKEAALDPRYDISGFGICNYYTDDGTRVVVEHFADIR